MKRINLNNFAKEVASCEALKQQVSIAQIKEIIKCILTLFAAYGIDAVVKTIEYHNKKDKK